MLEKVKSAIIIAIGVFGAVCGKFFGEFDLIFSSLVIFIVVDFSTGVLKSLYHKETNSKISFKGIIKKVALLTMVVVAYRLEIATGIPTRDPILWLLIGNEGISILENLATLGAPIPKFLKDRLAQLKDFSDKSQNHDNYKT